MSGGARMRIEVVYSPSPGQVQRRALTLPEGATVADGLRASGLNPDPEGAALLLGVWGRTCTPQALLRDLDRIEVYRPLSVDPKEARRLRYRGGAKR